MLPATRSAAAGRTPVIYGGVKGSYIKTYFFLTGKPRPGFNLKMAHFLTVEDSLQLAAGSFKKVEETVSLQGLKP